MGTIEEKIHTNIQQCNEYNTTHYTIQLSETFLDVEIFDIVGCIGEFPSMFRLKCTVPSTLGWC